MTKLLVIQSHAAMLKAYLYLVLYLSGKGAEGKGSKLMLFMLDGLRWDYFDQQNLDLPGFKRMFRNGIKAEYTTVDFPSLSLPNYYTIMTENHGMIGNNIYDPQSNKYFLLSNLTTYDDPLFWNDADPLWVSAERQGKKSYMYYWLGGGVVINGVRPTFYEPYFYDNGRIPDVQETAASIRKGIDLFKKDAADLVAIYFEPTDALGHSYGPKSTTLNQKLVELDSVFMQLQDNLTAEGLADDIVFMIFSDHGMTGIQPERVINLTAYIDPNDLKALMIEAGPLCTIYPKDGKLEKVHHDLMSAVTQVGHFTVYRKNDIPDSWHYKNHRRVAPLVAVADVGWFILQHSYKDFPSKPASGPLKGYHGYDPTNPDMRGIFAAAGPGIRKNVITKPIDAVDIYQLMCHVLDIKPSPNNGTWSRVAGMLTDTSTASVLSYMFPPIVLCSILTFSTVLF